MRTEFGVRNSEFDARRSTLRRSFRIPNSDLRIRRAFTLFEITLVLALLLAICAMAWPALDGVFDSERLKYAADQLRSDFIRARVTAMNTGRVHSFSWDAATGRYFVVAVDEGSVDAFSVSGDTSAGAMLPVIDRAFPEGITLLSVASLDDVTPPPAAAMAPGFGAGATPTVAAGMSNVFFHPDGTTSSALVTLSNQNELFLDVRLRGLTGGTAVGEVLATQGVQ